MENKKTMNEERGDLEKLIGKLGIDVQTVEFRRRNSLSTHQDVQVHEIDLPLDVLDSDLGATASPWRECFDSRSIDLGGWAVTGDAGKRIWKLSDFVCDSNSRVVYRQPVSFVATPLSEEPVSMTVIVRSTGSDLVVEVFSWDASGAAAPRVGFSWRCWVDTISSAQGAGPADIRQPPPEEDS